MEIKIKTDNNNDVKIEFDNQNIIFNYDSMEKLIDYVVANPQVIFTYDCDEKLSEYKEIVASVIEGAKSDDFMQAVKNAEDSSVKS